MFTWLTIALLSSCGLDPLKDPDVVGDSGTTSVGGLQIEPGSIDFGAVEVGSVASESVVLSNGGAESIELAALSLYGDSTFTITTETALPLELGAGAEQVVDIEFAPTGETSFESTLQVALSGVSELGEVALMGTGGTGGDTDTGSGGSSDGLALSTTRIDFGTVSTNSTASEDVTFRNAGIDDILIVDIVSSDRTVTYSGELTPPEVIAGGSSKVVTFTYEPTAEVALSATITVTTDPSEYGTTITATGMGEVTCTLCRSNIEVETGGSDSHTLDGFFSLSGSTDSKDIIVQNTGDMDLVITDATINNDWIATCGEFELTAGGATTIGPSDSELFTVAYTATSTCLDTASVKFDSNVLHILNNDPTNDDYVISLGGLGL